MCVCVCVCVRVCVCVCVSVCYNKMCMYHNNIMSRIVLLTQRVDLGCGGRTLKSMASMH